MTDTKLELGHQDTVEELDAALDCLLRLRVALGGLPASLPHHGFDQALGASQSYQDARARFRSAWDALMEKVPGGSTCPQALDLEARTNEMSVVAAEVSWQMAMAAGVDRLDR